jgi:hypothetical protein
MWTIRSWLRSQLERPLSGRGTDSRSEDFGERLRGPPAPTSCLQLTSSVSFAGVGAHVRYRRSSNLISSGLGTVGFAGVRTLEVVVQRNAFCLARGLGWTVAHGLARKPECGYAIYAQDQVFHGLARKPPPALLVCALEQVLIRERRARAASAGSAGHPDRLPGSDPGVLSRPEPSEGRHDASSAGQGAERDERRPRV